MEGNPLLNPLVVGEILKLLPRKDLLISRQVCSLWEEEASRILRKELTLHFQDLCQVTVLTKLLEGIGGQGEQGRLLPFARVNLRTSFRLGHPVSQEFFSRYGRLFLHVGVGKVGSDCGLNLLGRLLFLQATELQSLSLAILATPLRLSNPQEEGKLLLPNLRVLFLRHQLFLERLPFLRDLLTGSPHLQEISTDPTSPSFVANVLIPTLLETRHAWNHLMHIHSPPLTFAGPGQLFRWVSTKNPPLRSLRLHFNHSPSGKNLKGEYGNSVVVGETGLLQSSHVRLLLQSLQRTLRSLELNNQGSPGNFNLEEALPPGGLPLLRKLSVMNFLVEGKSVFPRLPNLRDLSVLMEEPFTSPGLILEDSKPASLVTRLALRTSPGGVSAATEWWGNESRSIGLLEGASDWWGTYASSFVLQVAETFPSLRDLRVWGANDTFLQEVYAASFAPLLESLEVYGPVSDAGLTGHSPATCLRLHGTQDYTLRENEVPQGFIGDLTRLKRLVVQPPHTNGDSSSSPALTEVCVFFGLTSCRDLANLNIRPDELLTLWKDEKSRALELLNLSTSSVGSTKGPCSIDPRALLQNVSALPVFTWRVILPLYGLFFASILSLYLS